MLSKAENHGDQMAWEGQGMRQNKRKLTFIFDLDRRLEETWKALINHVRGAIANLRREYLVVRLLITNPPVASDLGLLQPSEIILEYDQERQGLYGSQVAWLPIYDQSTLSNIVTDCLNSLRFKNTRYWKISTHCEHTLEWLWRNPAYRSWSSSEHSSFLFIEGKTGSGKSTLVRYFTDHWREDGAIIAKFFYSYRDGELERDHRNMLQSLLYHILKADETFFIHFQQDYRNLRDAELDWWTGTTWPYETLKNILQSCSAHPLKRRLLLIVDAMDESDNVDRAKIVQLLWDLSVAADKECVVKVFLASRPIGEFHPQFTRKCNRIQLQIENTDDIRKYTHGILNNEAFDLAKIISAQVEDYIIKNAHGVFLWVSLVRDELLRFVQRGSARDTVLNFLKELPKGLESYYEYMFQKLNSDDGDDTRDGTRIFQFCLFSPRAVQLLELGHALAIPAELQDLLPDASSWEDKRPIDVRNRLLHCTGNLVEIRNTPISRLDGKFFVSLMPFYAPKLTILSSYGGTRYCSSNASDSASIFPPTSRRGV